MKHRKPRYALYELQRMSIGQLKGLFTLNSRRTNSDLTANIVEKSELIQLLIDTDRVHLIPSPKPVQYQLSLLQAMGVGQLKRTMEEAGVFFERCNVVEKSDMVTIFQNSGRLELLPEDDLPAEALPAKENEETVEERIWSSRTWMPNPGTTAEPDQEEQWSAAMPSSSAFRIETVESEDEDEGEGDSHGGVDRESQSMRVRREGDTPTFTPVEMFGQPDEDMSVPPQLTRTPPTSGPPSVSTSSTIIGEAADSSSSSVAMDDYAGNELVSSSIIDPQASSNNNTARPSPRASSSERPVQSMANREWERSFDGQDHDDDHLDAEPGIDIHESPPGTAINSAATSAAVLEFQDCSISELQSIGRRCNVDLSQCVERREMVQLLSAAHASVLGQQRPLSSQTLYTWSVSQIRAVAVELQIDLSQCTNKEEMVQQLVHVANEDRPHLRDYLRALSPLATSTLSELRALARDWNVNIGDCLEKDEIIQRLVTRGQSFGIC
jgi:hypothetical protein